MKHFVYLIPGFFGFSSIGQMRYFAHVHRYLEAALRERGLDAAVQDVPTRPTAGLRRRAGRLLDVIEATAGTQGAVHLIGHSTGGLDARVLVSPAVALRDGRNPELIAQRVRTVISVSSPHNGTPLASYLETVEGQAMLKLLSALTLHVVRRSSLPIDPLALLVRGVGLLGRPEGVPHGLLEQVYQQVLSGFDAERRQELAAFFDEVYADQALLQQLTPAGMREVKLWLRDRPGIFYGSVVTRARRPGSLLEGLTSPEGRLSYALYRPIHALTARTDPALPIPDDARIGHISRLLGEPLRHASNDAIVPTISQIHGEVVSAVWGDHLDVIGYFRGREHSPPHVDWLRTLSGFDRARFESIWGRIADRIAATAAVGIR